LNPVASIACGVTACTSGSRAALLALGARRGARSTRDAAYAVTISSVLGALSDPGRWACGRG
jgi:hypothetical protein